MFMVSLMFIFLRYRISDLRGFFLRYEFAPGFAIGFFFDHVSLNFAAVVSAITGASIRFAR